MQHRRASRTARVFAPAVAIATAMTWILVLGLPTAPRAGSPGRLESATIELTGSPGASRGKGAARGWSEAVDLAAGTQMVALTWNDDAAAAGAVVSLRSRHGGEWSPWRSEGAESDDTPDGAGNGRTGVGPVWLGATGADRVEVRIDRGQLRDLSLLKMRWVDPQPGSNGAAHAEAAGPSIRPRSAWTSSGWAKQNTDCSKGPERMDQLKFAVIHHTVNANDYSASQVPGILAGIYEYHTKSRGWCDIAYNFVVDRFGTVWQARSGDINIPVLGGHAKGFNADSVGIALLGQYEPGGTPAATRPSAAQVSAVESLLAWKLSIHGIDPLGKVSVVSNGSPNIPAGRTVTIPTIVGHLDVGSTDCPGKYMYDNLRAVREAVAEQIDAGVSPAKWKPFTSPRAVGDRNFADFLGRPATNTDSAGWASLLQRDGATPSSLISEMLDGGEFNDRTAPTVRLYLAYFRRKPDHDGLTFWLNQSWAKKTTLSKMSSSFAGSSEFERTYGSLDNEGFVNRVYQNVLGRPGEGDGLAFWTDQLDSGKRTRGAVMTGFSESSENRRVVKANVSVTMIYEAMLGREASDSAYASWVAKLNAGTPATDLIAQAYYGSEYASRVATFASV